MLYGLFAVSGACSEVKVGNSHADVGVSCPVALPVDEYSVQSHGNCMRSLQGSRTRKIPRGSSLPICLSVKLQVLYQLWLLGP